MTDQQPENREWYVRRSATVQGPFAADRIRRYLLLGRLRLGDRVSTDGTSWEPVTQRPELIPEEMRDLGSEAGRARFEEARRAVDERAVEREPVAASGADASLVDGEAPAAVSSRRRRRPALAVLAFGGLAALAVALVAVGYYRDFDREQGVGTADCDSPDSRVWNGCVMDGLVRPPGTVLAELEAVNASLRNAHLEAVDLSGARLDHVDLSGASLAGADLRSAVLRGAILREADLRRADLRHSDLRGAELGDARLDRALLGNALWIDGRGCAADSVGACE